MYKINGGVLIVRRKTQADFVKDVYDLWGKEYSVLGEYKGTHKKIMVRHNKCGREFEITPASLLMGSGCKACGYARNGKNRRFTQKDFEAKVKKHWGDEYKVVGKYVNSQTKVKIKHVVCGRILNLLPASFLSGHGCTHCNHHTGRLLTNDEFLRRLHKMHGDEYTALTPYEDTHTKVVLRHEICGNVFEMRPNNIFNGQGCPYCHNKEQIKKRTIAKETVLDRFKKYKDYTIVDDLSTYENTHTPIKIKHKKCGHVFKMSPHAFWGGERCSYCQHLGASKG